MREVIDPKARYQVTMQILREYWVMHVYVRVKIIFSKICIRMLLSVFYTCTLLIATCFWLSMCSGGMNGYMHLCEGEACPAMFTSPVDGMPNITSNQVL